MSWNYRVIQEGGAFSVREVYAHKVTGHAEHVTVDPCAPFGESVEELRADLDRMTLALRLPVIQYGDIPCACEDCKR